MADNVQDVLPIVFPALYQTKNHWNKTIHGLVYNALKLFMDMNQKLFDELSQEQKLRREREREKLTKRAENWRKVEDQAKKNPSVSE